MPRLGPRCSNLRQEWQVQGVQHSQAELCIGVPGYGVVSFTNDGVSDMFSDAFGDTFTGYPQGSESFVGDPPVSLADDTFDRPAMMRLKLGDCVLLVVPSSVHVREFRDNQATLAEFRECVADRAWRKPSSVREALHVTESCSPVGVSGVLGECKTYKKLGGGEVFRRVVQPAPH